MENQGNETVQIKDITLAATLLYFNFPIRDLVEDSLPSHHDSAKKPFTYFIFKETPELRSTISDFETGRVVVEPKKFSGCLRECKSRMYDSQTRGGSR